MADPAAGGFPQHEPDIDVRITTGGAAVPFGDDWSCGIKLGDGEWPGLIAEPLFAADLLPVCTLRLANTLKRPGDLKGPTLLRVAHRPTTGRRWPQAAGIARVIARGLEFRISRQALQAPVDGLGIAMGIRPYIDDDLAAGRLVAPFALSVRKGMRWYLVYRGFSAGQRDFAAFGAGSCARRRSPRRAARASDMPDETDRDAGDRRRPGWPGDELPAQVARSSHLVLERHRIAERWRSDAGRSEIPVSELVGAAAGLSVSAQRSRWLRDNGEIIDFIDAYAAFVGCDPLRRRGDAAAPCDGTGFVAETTDGAIAADNVVVATGPYQRDAHSGPAARSSGVSGPCQRLSNPEQLPPGVVLVVGAGASGAHIAE